MDNKKIDIMSNIKNILPENDRSKLVNCNGDNFFNKEKKQGEYSEAEQHLQATNWKYYLKACIKTGLESPIPYKVIPYKNGIGIKKIEFFKPIKNGSL